MEKSCFTKMEKRKLLEGSIKFLVYFCDLKGKWRWWFPLLMGNSWKEFKFISCWFAVWRNFYWNILQFQRKIYGEVFLVLEELLKFKCGGLCKSITQKIFWIKIQTVFRNTNLGPKKINLSTKKNEKKTIRRVRLHNSSALSHYKRFIISFSNLRSSHKYFPINI